MRSRSPSPSTIGCIHSKIYAEEGSIAVMKEEKEKLERELQEMRKEKESLEENFASIKRVVDDGGVGSATKEGGGGRLGDHSSGGDVLEPACTNNEGEVVTLTLSRIFQSEGKGNVDASCVLFRSSN